MTTYTDAQAQVQNVEQTIRMWQEKRAEKHAEIARLERDAPLQVLEGKLSSEEYSR